MCIRYDSTMLSLSPAEDTDEGSMLLPTAACCHTLQSSKSSQALTRRSICCRWAAWTARTLRSCWAVTTSTLSNAMAMRHLLAVMDELFTKHSTLADCRVMQSALLNTSAGCKALEGLSQQCEGSVRAISAVGRQLWQRKSCQLSKP